MRANSYRSNTLSVEEDSNDYDYEAAKAAELQAICDEQIRVYLSKQDVYEATFAKLSLDVCNNISTQARQMRNYASTSLSYGELDYVSFGTLVCSLTKQGIDLGNVSSFIDLGSGAGKTVICAALLGIFEKCTGIEILAELHKTSTQMLKQFYRHNQNNAEVVAIEFVSGDAAFVDWSGADMIFAHTTCFDETIMKRIADTACKMKEGCIFITISNKLSRDDLFVLVATAEVQASWGSATAFVYRRNALPAPGAVNDPMLHLQEVLNRPIPI